MLTRHLDRLTRAWEQLTRHQWMTREDEDRWLSAASLDDVGQLVADWLEGKLASQPGYCPNCGPDPETKHLVPVLAAANRSGYVTIASQPGMTETGDDGAHWQQRAAVQGFTNNVNLDRLRGLITELTGDTGLRLTAQQARCRERGEYGTTVTTRSGVTYTDFGAPLSRWTIRDLYDVLHDDALDALLDAWQVTIVDPVWGRDDVLWPLLERFSDRTGLEAR